MSPAKAHGDKCSRECDDCTRIVRNGSSTFTVRVDAAVKKRLEKLAKNTGCGRSFLTAEAISEYIDANEWQVAGLNARWRQWTVANGRPRPGHGMDSFVGQR